MRVAQLIKELEKMPKSALVVVDGYEGGQDAIAKPVLGWTLMNTDQNDHESISYYGLLEFAEKRSFGAERAILLRASR